MDKIIVCSNCKTRITQNYCPNCGQKYISRKLKLKEIFADYWDNFFSFDASLWLSFKLLILKPEFIVHNYWQGFRNYFVSPNKLLLISTLFLGLNFILYKNHFLGIIVNAENFSAQIGFLIMVLPFLTVSSYITYIGLKHSFLEHLVLNMYSLGIWLIIFSIVSILQSYFKFSFLIQPLRILFILLIFAWNSRSFKLTLLKRIIFTALNIFGLVIAGTIYLVALGSKTS